MCVQEKEKREQWYWVMGLKMEQLTLSMGPARAEVRSYVQSKRVIHTLNIHKIQHM
jgi:hypothetical protein